MIRIGLITILGLLLTGCANLPPGYPFRLEHEYGVADPQFARTMGHFLGPPIVAGNSIETLINGDQIFPAMLEGIRSAKRTVCFETFIFWKSEIGAEFTKALCERAKAGVKVHILIDAIGGGDIDEEDVKALKECGCELQIYYPLHWFDITSAARLNNRTHRKLLIIDGKLGFTGGVGIAQAWTGNAQDKQHWRDNHYRITGPVVNHLQSAFMDHWAEANGGVLHGEDYFPKVEPTGEQWAQVFKSGPSGGSESMQLMFLLSFAAARQRIWIGTAYFVPDDLTLDALIKARKRGVEVKILIPAGELNDVPISVDASRGSWGKILAEGIEIYEYQPTMYHVKLMIVDDRWVSMGSSNLHNRAFRLNGEANLNVLDTGFAAEQAKLFEQDLKASRRCTYEEWMNRPFGDKLREAFFSDPLRRREA